MSKTPRPENPTPKTTSKTAKTRAARVAGTAVVAAGVILPGLVLPGSAAFAATGPSGLNVGSGNQALLSLNLPADICGLAVALLGTAESSCQGGSVVQGAQPSGGTNAGKTSAASGGDSVASGNKVSVPVSAPVNVCGVSIAILGSAQSSCQGGSKVVVKPATPSGPGAPGQPGVPGTPGWPGNPGGPSGPTWPGGGSGHHHKHHKHHGSHHTSTKHHTTTTVTTSTTSKTPASTAALSSGLLPTTGANIAGLLAAALACLGLGAGVVATERRYRKES